MTRLVPIAEVVKAVGLRGEVKLYPLLDFHGPLLDSGYLCWEDGSPARVTGARPQAGGIVVKPEGTDDRDGAERLVGRELCFRRADYGESGFPRPADGLPFRYLDRPVRLGDGEQIGTVVEVRRYAGQVLLVVRHDGREVLIPAVAPILHPDAGTEGPLVIDPPEGLLDGAGD